MKLTIDVSNTVIANVLCCAFEGGVGYWCCIVDHLKPTVVWSHPDWREVFPHVHYPLSYGGGLVLLDEEEDTKYQLTRVEIQQGLKVMHQKYPRHFADMLDESRCDAVTGDVFLQCSLFGEVIYG